MQFSVKEWRRMYNVVQDYGVALRKSRPTYDLDDNYVAPEIDLSKKAQEALEGKIKFISLKISAYLDQCGIKPKKPLWHYDNKDPETHMSSPEFKYGHLFVEVVWHQ